MASCPASIVIAGGAITVKESGVRGTPATRAGSASEATTTTPQQVEDTARIMAFPLSRPSQSTAHILAKYRRRVVCLSRECAGTEFQPKSPDGARWRLRVVAAKVRVQESTRIALLLMKSQ